MARIKPRINEKYLFSFHKSFISQWRRLGRLILLIILAIIASVFISNDGAYFLTFGLFMLALIYSMYIFWVWFQNVVIVTNQRIIMVERVGIFHQKVSEFDAIQIRNVVYEIKGLINSLTHTGKIILELVGDDKYTIDEVYGPEEIHDSIRALIRAHRC